MNNTKMAKVGGGFYYYDPPQDIGDYIEAEFVGELGIVKYLHGGPQGPAPVFGFALRVTLSANAEEPRLVEFQIASPRQAKLLQGREPGEKLVMTTIRMQLPEHNWEWRDLVVNGERITPAGRVKV